VSGKLKLSILLGELSMELSKELSDGGEANSLRPSGDQLPMEESGLCQFKLSSDELELCGEKGYVSMMWDGEYPITARHVMCNAVQSARLIYLFNSGGGATRLGKRSIVKRL